MDPRSVATALFFDDVADHADAIYGLCLRVTGNVAEADDLTQETLIRALEKQHLYDPSRPLRPWLLTMAGNLARSRMRTVWWRRVEDGEKLARIAAVPEVGSERDRERVRQAVQALPEPSREAIELHDFQELTYAEMSLVTGASVDALKQRVRRGRLKLRDRLSA